MRLTFYAMKNQSFKNPLNSVLTKLVKTIFGFLNATLRTSIMKKKNKVLENKNLIEEEQSDNIETEEKNLTRNLFSEDIEENENNNELNINDLNNKNHKESNINNENNNEKNNNIIIVLPEEIDLTKFN